MDNCPYSTDWILGNEKEIYKKEAFYHLLYMNEKHKKVIMTKNEFQYAQK